jgi:hypothetical protein
VGRNLNQDGAYEVLLSASHGVLSMLQSGGHLLSVWCMIIGHDCCMQHCCYIVSRCRAAHTLVTVL